jgi:cobalt-precorrin 5A hydrolase/precorrin-3B C17-methyltransferase
MLTLVLIGNSTSRLQDGRMVTPRGYPGASLGPASRTMSS